MQRTVLGAACVGIVLSSPWAWGALITYSGGLNSSEGGIIGSGSWLTEGGTFTWTVSRTDGGPWHYEYTLVTEDSDVSHFILEVSDTFNENDMFNAQGPFGSIDIDWFYPGPSNSAMPDDVYGIKFDDAMGTTFQISFDSWRAPVWGDFYAKDGKSGGVDNAVWNGGFVSPDVDPCSGPSNGSVGGHVLVPDTIEVPEPATVLILALGFTGMLLRRKR